MRLGPGRRIGGFHPSDLDVPENINSLQIPIPDPGLFGPNFEIRSSKQTCGIFRLRLIGSTSVRVKFGSNSQTDVGVLPDPNRLCR